MHRRSTFNLGSFLRLLITKDQHRSPRPPPIFEREGIHVSAYYLRRVHVQPGTGIHDVNKKGEV